MINKQDAATKWNDKPNNKDLTTILDYEDLINKIKLLVKKQHHELIEDLAENIFEIIFQNRLVKKTKIKSKSKIVVVEAISEKNVEGVWSFRTEQYYKKLLKKILIVLLNLNY